MKIGIITAYTEDNKWTDSGTCDFVLPAAKNHIEYCIEHNYSYICEVFSETEYNEYHPTWIKVLALQRHLMKYDYLVWIDADCVVTNLNVKVERFIEDGNVSLIVPKAEKDYNTNIVWTAITTGFMIVKNSTFSVQLLSHLLNSAGRYRFDDFHEQTVLDNYLRSFGYYTDISSLNYKLEDDLTGIMTVGDVSFIPYRYHRVSENANYEYIYHAGGSSDTKKKRIEAILNNINV